MAALDKDIPEPAREQDKPFLMAIEDVFSISGRGTVITGRIERGKIKVGEKAQIIGLRDTQETVVTGVEMFQKTLDEGIAGDNVGLLLRGTGKDDVERGQVLAARTRSSRTRSSSAKCTCWARKKGAARPRSSADTVPSSTSARRT